MLTAIGIGIIVGILLIVGLLRLTMGEDPTGCMVLLAALIFLACWGGGLTRLVILVW